MSKILFLISTLIFNMSSSFAGDQVGNGGDAVVCYSNDKRISAQLLDFYEMELLGKRPHFDISDNLKESARKALESLSKVDHINYKKLKKDASLFMENAVFLEGIDLVDIQDSSHVVIPKHCKIEQLSIMNIDHPTGRPKYTLNKDIWILLDKVNKAGLILHEIIYEMFLRMGHKNSVMARVFNEYVTTNYLENISQKDFLMTYKKLKVPYFFLNTSRVFLDLQKEMRFYREKISFGHIKKKKVYPYGFIEGRTYFHDNGEISLSKLVDPSDEVHEGNFTLEFLPGAGEISFYKHGGL
ncbi:hypothetical protein OAT67_09860, partial [Bacteriovoracaceae bacterium]|nr:hypothetical protein [Bacteriovoracaceae bacterium]